MSRMEQDVARGLTLLAAEANAGMARFNPRRAPVETAPWTPTPDYATHAAPPNRSIWRDLIALTRKALR